ncbi:uncharacterized protein LOC124439015 [Xenia sp. Carnegie-2017]|uniref:uncharacterized protein LOC124439015 n=1 Tax=Xenia sp. Carnegie-2017 TaxID=2897299 RepID=UPI001F039444|nr:uncharacterized protein LOC124439015 [Xenia sp. Carnegie-2017]
MNNKKTILLFLMALTTLSAASRSRNYFADYLFRRGVSGCTQKEINGLVKAGVDLAKSSIDCSNDFMQFDEVKQKRGCGIDYYANPSCCSPGCNWILELHCMSPVQMICKKK